MKNDNDVRRLRRELIKTDGNLSMSAKKSGMDRKTASKYQIGSLPSEVIKEEKERQHKTRESPFSAEHEREAKKLFEREPIIQATTLLDFLQETYPKAGYTASHLRTLQRRLRSWALARESFREAHFKQEWHPGKVMQLDWTWMKELQITIKGKLFIHRLCHAIFPYSNWSWATICFSESLLSLKEGFQEAAWRAGGLPHVLQTDNSSAATHRLGRVEKEVMGQKRDFNGKYKSFMKELDVQPQTIPVRCSNANADIESRNGHLKNYMNQRLLLRGNRDFYCREDYQLFLEECLEGMNRKNTQSLFDEEKQLLKTLPPERLPCYETQVIKVSKESLILLDKNTYSVPNKLIGETLNIEKHEDKIKVYQKGKGKLFTIDKLHGHSKISINFMHLVDPLLRKAGAFRNYRYQAHFFPGSQFRRCYDKLCSKHSDRQADQRYLQILKLACDHVIIKIDSCLQDILNEGQAPSSDELKKRLEIPAMAYPEIKLEAQLSDYACFDFPNSTGTLV